MDPRVQAAARSAADNGLAHVTLLAPTAEEARAASKNLPGSVDVAAPESHPDFTRLRDAFSERRGEKKGAEAASLARSLASKPHFFANLMVRDGLADGAVAGAVLTSGDVARAAMQVLGPAPGVSTASSFFLVEFPEGHEREGAVLFADCGVVVAPTADELAEICLQTAASATRLLPEEDLPARAAMLSFSTRGSASHPAARRVAEAFETVQKRRVALADALDAEGALASHPAFGTASDLRALLVDGELQLDAACSPDVAAAKAPSSPLRGAANVYVFPSLEAGNIAYKMAQRFAGARTVGPIMQGLAAPSNDLSRGCSAEDIVDAMVITALQAS
jgi:phosphate acetyltransferase